MKTLFFWPAVVSPFVASGCSRAMRFFRDKIKDFPSQTQEQIRNSRVAVGMTTQQVRFAWGGPHSITVPIPSEDSKERVEWVYGNRAFFTSRLIFTDSKVAEIISYKPGFAK